MASEVVRPAPSSAAANLPPCDLCSIGITDGICMDCHANGCVIAYDQGYEDGQGIVEKINDRIRNWARDQLAFGRIGKLVADALIACADAAAEDC